MREKVRMVSTAGTGHFYTASVNKKLQKDKMQRSKYDPKARKHVLYKETKMKK